MNWTLAIDRNRDALLRMLAMLVAMAGGDAADVLPRYVRTEIWRHLRPAESALRRLIVIVKQVMAIEVRAVARVAPVCIVKGAAGDGPRVPSFPLFDGRRRFDSNNLIPVTRGQPRLWSPGMDYPVFVTKPVPLPDDMVSAERLGRRILALQNALGDLPKQARRLARYEAKRMAGQGETGKMIRPLRPGRPPGHRARQRYPVDTLLADCHALALYALHDPPDAG